LLCVHDIFVNNKGGSLCVVGYALANLAADAYKSTESIEPWLYDDIPNRTKFAKKLKELFRSNVVTKVLDKEGTL